jgi:hypothetical protein
VAAPVKPPVTSHPHLVALDDQLGAYLRGRGDSGAMTAEVYHGVQPPSGPHVYYAAVLGSLWRLARAGLVDVFSCDQDCNSGALWWVWRALPVRVPGATLAEAEEE